MKKTILLASFMTAAIAGAADTEQTLTFTTVNSTSNTVTNAWHNGITLNLNPELENSRLSTSTETPGYTLSGFSTVELLSITTNIRSIQSQSGIVLALTDSAGKVLSLSTNIVTGIGDQTWTFSNTSISTTEQLYFVFTSSTNENVVSGYTLTTNDMVMCGSSIMSNYSNTTGVSSLSYLGSNTEHSMTPGSANFAPRVTLVTQTQLVPEPATATLSLLALAGLAARRRRK